MNLNLTGKTAMVCGSTQGIGKAVALELASMGANVILVARTKEKLQSVLGELASDNGQKHSFIAVDFSDNAAVKKAVQHHIDSHGTVHVLVNNTGGPPSGPITNASDDEFLTAFKNHLINNHNLATILMDGMKKDGYGRIINIISTSVKQPLPNLGVSNTVRAAVGNWSKTLAGEVAKFGITVNNVLPGATNTIRLQQIAEVKSQKTGQSVKEVFEEMAAEVPMKRIGEAHEIAAAVAFLASPAASYINGINVPVDGGRTACL